MKLSFSMRVPWRDRLKILFLGGLYVFIEYRGQHKITDIKCEAMRVKDNSATIKKEKADAD